MANQAKSLSAGRQNFSRAQIAARQSAEEMVVTNQTKPKANETVKNHSIMRKLFNKLKNLNDHFTEADSIALNTLTFNIYHRALNENRINEYDIEDERYERFLLRIEKFNRMIDNSMKQLCIPLNSRLSLANDMAKVMIEEKKLEAMEASTVQEVNPVYALLKDIDELY